jgi:small multidrug resistance family-3 protein
MPPFAQSALVFAIAGLCEIGGGWLVWQFWRNERSWLLGLAGGVALLLYGIIPTYQEAHFGCVYPAYGGAFMVLSLLWGAVVVGNRPDVPDMVGAAVALAGMAIIMYWPR